MSKYQQLCMYITVQFLFALCYATIMFHLYFHFIIFVVLFPITVFARRDGAEEAGWTLDRKIRVRFPAYPHRVWAL